MSSVAPPIVSLAGMRSRHPADRAAVGAAVRDACLDKGFLYIVDHGIPSRLTHSVLQEARRFFALPSERKEAVSMRLSSCNRGYEPMRSQTLEGGAPPDLKEGFYIGTELAATDPRVAGGLFNHGPNLWPAGLPGWREAMDEYFAQMLGLCRLTMQALALALDLRETYFDDFCREPFATLRLLHYPPQPPNALPDEKGCGAHTDFGAITYLLQDDAGGLQVWDQMHGWVDAPPLPGAYVLNLGDMTARWTNDRFRSTLHRVINRSGCHRTSVPFFFDGRPDYEICCLPGCKEPGETAKYAPTTPIGHLQEMYAQIYRG